MTEHARTHTQKGSDQDLPRNGKQADLSVCVRERETGD